MLLAFQGLEIIYIDSSFPFLLLAIWRETGFVLGNPNKRDQKNAVMLAKQTLSLGAFAVKDRDHDGTHQIFGRRNRVAYRKA